MHAAVHARGCVLDEATRAVQLRSAGRCAPFDRTHGRPRDRLSSSASAAEHFSPADPPATLPYPRLCCRLAPAGPGEFVGHGGETVLIPLPKGGWVGWVGGWVGDAPHCCR